MRKRFASVAGLTALAVLGGCDYNPVGYTGPSRFVASIEGSVTASYEGTGIFHTTPPGLPRPFSFALQSQGTGSASNQGFEFLAKERPATGLYELRQGNLLDGDFLHAAFTVREGNTISRFAAQAGEVEITDSTPDRVEGTFQFTGVLRSICEESRSMGGHFLSCTGVTDHDPPTVRISGTFEAVSGRRSRW